jgi:hypothetical protein
MAKKLKRTVPYKASSKEGLFKGKGDAWFHPEVFDEEYEHKTNKAIRRFSRNNRKVISKCMELYIDLEKGRLNTAKLVKRPVQVRGKDGKIYTRMQWVDPHSGEPVNNQRSLKLENEKEQPKFRSQKEYIDHYVKNLSRDEKYHLIDKHGIKWERNHHEAIDHKNAVMALKEHLYKNPHLVGVEHLPKEPDGSKTPEGTDRIDEWLKKYKNHPELLYRMMHHAGVLDDPTDPRTVPEWGPKDKGGNGTAPIRHMRNMMTFKKHLKENPHLMDLYDSHEEFGLPNTKTGSKSHKPEPKVKSKAQEGGNTIHGILKNMSSEELYALMKRLGIADRDPRTVPEWGPKDKGGNGTAPIRHMRNMMALKKAIERDPSILNLDENGDLSEQEKERLASLSGKEKLSHDVDEFLKGVDRKLVLAWADTYDWHDHMKNRIKSDHEHIDNMHKISALKKIIMDNPHLMEEGPMKEEFDTDRLLKTKIKNKEMQKILREVVGLKGVGDVKQAEKGVEWSFGVASFARIDKDQDGKAVLSVVDAGKDGSGWDEYVFPMEDVVKYLEKIRNGKQAKLKSKEVPLHKKSPAEMWKAIEEDFDKNYTHEVGEELKDEIGMLYRTHGFDNVDAFLKELPVKVSGDTFRKLLDKYGVLYNHSQIYTDGEAWKEVVYKSLVEKTKTKNASEYLVIKPGTDEVDTWVLHQSAKHWSPEERAQARKELIHRQVHIEDEDGFEDKEHRRVKLVDHIHQALEFVPFDLMTDVLCSGKGVKLKFMKTGEDGGEHYGNYFGYRVDGPVIYFDHRYVKDDSVLKASHPLDHTPKPRLLGISRKLIYSAFADTCAHEFAHAIDHFLSGSIGTYLTWDNPIGRKYAEGHTDAVIRSYKASVERSNPKKYLGAARNGNTRYFWHLDEWISSYEGRIYNRRYTDPSLMDNYIGRDENGQLLDKAWDTETDERGLEHWSENTSRYANAFHAYRRWREETGNTSTSMDSWARQMYEKFMDMGYGDDSNKQIDGKLLARYTAGIRTNPIEGYGYLWHRMKQVHPELHGSLNAIFGRGDFVDKDDVANRKELFERGDYTRKSEEPKLIIEL